MSERKEMSDGPWFRFYRRIGRLQLRLIVWKHEYPSSSDRWVVQPSVIWDRKERV